MFKKIQKKRSKHSAEFQQINFKQATVRKKVIKGNIEFNKNALQIFEELKKNIQYYMF